MDTEMMTSQTSEESTASTDDFSIDEAGTEQASEEPAEEAASEPTAEPFLRIRYNGADEDLTAEQAKELAEKGRNYDKVKAQRD